MKQKLTKLTSLILTITMMLSIATIAPFAVNAVEKDSESISVTNGDYKYDLLDDGKAEITSYNGKETVLIIPSKIDGHTVTNIGWGSFRNCINLTSVTIPNSVVSIGDYAFYNCSSLKSITIPDSVTIIGYSVFEGCTSLEIATIGKSVTSISGYMFSNCSSLKNITIPFNVTSIGNYAFDYCTSLSSITIPNSITSIGYCAFRFCESLTDIKIPNSVKSIGNSTFSGCTSLTDITIPNSVTNIGPYAFEECYSLTKIKIPDHVTSIGDSTFSSCERLINITIPDSVTSIGSGAFYNCYSLKKATIGKGVTTIGDRAFNYCHNLSDIYFRGSEQQWKSINIGSGNSGIFSAAIHYNYSVIKIVLSKKSVTLVKGRATTLKATIIPTNATNKKLKWTTSNSKVATVSKSGKITAKGKGTATIKAITLDGTQKYAICKVTVKQPVTIVKLNKKLVALKVKGKASQKSYTLKATVSPTNADNKSVKWTTSNLKIATVAQNGKVTSKKKGTCYITATAKDGSKKYAKCKIVVK